ncbi:hypothetical protein H6P81_020497 [Aristolochia fimbriata]|uniref:T-complex protein 11 n=1 Tax=Aristolochia fimbriata TaxID=158543 RepID=A0AAV7DUL4_ARIFI|nr:hypothetical protein H6P81_020497 [Aristolochia fimbriata]
MAAEFATPESRKAGGIAFDLPVRDTPAPMKVPRRVRKRLLENKSRLSVEEIEAKLNNAEVRRQQFHELLSSKARPKKVSSPRSSHSDRRQRLEAKLYAAGQKRLGILSRAQLRLARLDELRKAARIAVRRRCCEEQKELGTKIGLRAQQAELNRLLLQSTYVQRRAAAREKRDKLKIQRKLRESRYREQVHAAILQKSAAAEKKRLSFLEAEKLRAHAKVMEARRVALAVSYQRQMERRRLKCQIDKRLQMATRQRAELLQLRSVHTHLLMNSDKMKYGDLLARKLARLWKQFVKPKRTTFDLAKAYEDIGINEKSVTSMPFEQLASCIESSRVLQTSMALLDRLELRVTFSQPKSPSLANIDHLLKQLSLSNGRGRPAKSSKTNSATKGSHKEHNSPLSKRLPRYPSRVVLCAYMIHAHPDEVFSGRAKLELALAESAFHFIQEFELLIKIILNYAHRRGSGGQSSQSPTDAGHCNDVLGDGNPLSQQTFRSLLLSFDAAWCSYLRHFVEWKVEDSKSLVQDLAQAASQVNLFANQGYQVSPKAKVPFKPVSAVSGKQETGRTVNAMPDITSEDKEEKMEQSLSSSSASPFLFPGGPIFLPLGDRRVGNRSSTITDHSESEPGSSLLGFSSTVPGREDGQSGPCKYENPISVKEVLAHEIMHEVHKSFLDSFEVGKDASIIEGKIRETMEKAFWDGIEQDLKQAVPDYSRVVELVKEVRDELCEMAPKNWRQEIIDSVDPDILHQVLKSENPDLDYLGRVLRYALITLQKLSAPANEEEMKRRNSEVLNELGEISHANHTLDSSFVVAIVKGLRFVLEQIQRLKQEISMARIRLMEPIVRGPGGIDYLQKAFSDHYGDPSNALRSLPLTKLWLAVLRKSAEREWIEHVESLSSFVENQSGSLGTPSQELTPTTLRTGGAFPMASNMNLQVSFPLTSTGNHQPECKGETVDLLVRIGLLKLVNQIRGLTHVVLPETLKLNCLRLRTVQGQLQKIIVLITSTLILRQMLLTESIDSKHMDVESVVSDSTRKLSEELDRDPDVGVAKIAETICELPSAEGLEGNWKKIREGKEMMASMLEKSLRDGDPVFKRVSRAVYLATRELVLGGTGAKGRKLAERALRSVGASLLVDKLIKAAEVVMIVATVSVRVHGPWYSTLLQRGQNICE